MPFPGGFSYTRKGGGRCVGTMRSEELQAGKKENRRYASRSTEGYDQPDRRGEKACPRLGRH